MHSLSLSILLATVLFGTGQATANSMIETSFERVLPGKMQTFQQLQDTLIGGHYAAAESICAQIAVQAPDSPEELYARISVIYARMTDFEDSSGQGLFEQLISQCIVHCTDHIERQQTPEPLTYYLRGASLAAQGLWLNHSGAKVQGIKKLMKAKGDFDRCIRLDPTFYDAYLGRGAYRYAVASHASLLGWLPFIPSKSDGWEDMWIAVHKSNFSKWSALSSLVWFVIDDKNYDLADSICSVALERFPGSRTFLGSRLSLEKRRENWPDAYATALVLEQNFAGLDSTNGYELIGLRHTLMQLANLLGRPAEAKEWAFKGSTTPCTAEVALRRANKLADFENLLSTTK